MNAEPRKKGYKEYCFGSLQAQTKRLGSWKIKSPYATSTIAIPPLDINNQNQNQDQANEEMSYIPHSPYYPVHQSEFYEDA